MQSSCGADEPIAGAKPMANESRQASAVRQQAFDRITMSDNSRAQLGD
jgi:hypothetical protein